MGTSAKPSPRDMIGYGPRPPDAKWPGGARIAVQVVLNDEEGGENSILHGDAASETVLSEIIGAEPFEGTHHMSMESLYEYGSRALVAEKVFNSSDQFFTYLKDSFDTLYAEGETNPKMLSVGLHCRIVGRPGRFAALKRFVEYIQNHQSVWLARRVDIARHWRETYPYNGEGA